MAEQMDMAVRKAEVQRSKEAYDKVSQRLMDLWVKHGTLQARYTSNNPMVQSNRMEIEVARAEMKRLEEAINRERPSIAPVRVASAETWSPVLAPGEKPDSGAILSEAKRLMNQGRFDEALGRYIWCFNDAQRFDTLHRRGLPFSRAATLSAWLELARRYPKALLALTETRDFDTAEFAAGQGYSELFQDVLNINRELDDPQASIKLCKTVAEKDPRLAQQLYYLATALLLQQGEYELCSRFMGDPQARFNSAISVFGTTASIGAPPSRPPPPTPPTNPAEPAVALQPSNGVPTPSAYQPSMPSFATFRVENFVSQVCTLVEILVGTGHKTDAEIMSSRAVAVLDDPRLHSAVADAQARIAKRGK